MLNCRKISRYHLLHPLTGYIEHEDVRYQGEVVELSTAGFRVRLRDTPREAFIAEKNPLAFGEVAHKDQNISGFGEIRYVRPEGSDVLIGFKWDDVHADANIEKSFSIIAELIAEKSAGCVNLNDGVVELSGHVSSALADDIQQTVSPKASRLSLRECTSIDAGGLALLAALEDANVQLIDLDAEMRALLQHYRQEGPA
ncbi:MAG: hypothetical protein H6R10_3159 [Rhodocyclaceae bacterium]|nr:hypothetical protein [Rhodocyclaceae bacterium]